MLQYVSGGKWGLLLRRPLEAMTRTLPLVALLFVPDDSVFGKHLYQWVLYPDAASTDERLRQRLDQPGAGADRELQASAC